MDGKNAVQRIGERRGGIEVQERRGLVPEDRPGIGALGFLGQGRHGQACGQNRRPNQACSNGT